MRRPFTALLCIGLAALGTPLPATAALHAPEPIASISKVPGGVLQWGTSPYAPDSRPPADTLAGVTDVSAGNGFSVALKEGRVIAWGANDYGETDVPIDAESGVTAIAAGGSHALALRDGRVIYWGDNDYPDYFQEVPSDALSGVTAIAAGGAHSLALKDGRVIAWGTSNCGELDVPTDALSGVTAIEAGPDFSLAVKNGRVIVWGWDGREDEEGNYCSPMDSNIRNVPESLGDGVTAIAAGATFALALKDSGVVAWGDVSEGGLNVPAEARSGVSAISANRSFGLALKAGKVLAWGYNRNGTTSVPTSATSGVTAISAGEPSLAIKAAMAPSPPGLVVAAAGNASATVSWSAPTSDGGSPILGYTATAAPGGATCMTRGALTCIVSGLESGTIYTFTVTATNAHGTSRISPPSNPVTPSGTTVAPGAVTGLKATPLRGAIRVTWLPPADTGGVAALTYEYKVGKQPWRPTGATTLSVKGKRGVPLTVSVRAANAFGYGPAAVVRGTPK